LPFRPASIVVHPAAQESFDILRKDAARGRQPAQAIWKAFQAVVAHIKIDGQWGEVIPPRAIPRQYAIGFGVSNLYCVDLPAFHRLFYTIRDRDVIVLALVSHREYDRLMQD
jgi:hypothetical protein